MRNSTVRLIAVLLLAATLLTLTACHGSRGSAAFAMPESFDAEKPIEITFWAKNDTNKTQVAIYNGAIRAFEELYPNVTVNIRLYTDYAKIYNDVITNISTGTTPNVCITYPDHIATYLTGTNTVVPLDALIADDAYGLGGSALLFDSPRAEEVVPEYLAECRIGGVTYALPFMRSTEALFINKTYVEQLGFEIPDMPTWDWVFEVAEAATAKDADGVYTLNGQKVLIPFIYKSTDNMMIQYAEQAGSGFSTADGDVLLFNDTTKDLLYRISGHVKSGAFSTFKISSYPANFLNAGQCILAVDSTAGATWMGSRAPLLDIPKDQLVEFETVVRPVPQLDPSRPRMISQGPSVCIFNKTDPQEVLASWLFMQFLLTNDVQIAYAETEGYVPVTSKARDSAVYTDYLAREGENNSTYYDVKIKASKLLLAHTADTFTTPVFNGSASLRDAAGQLIENVAKSKRRKETVDEAYMTKLFADVTSLYHLDSLSAASGVPDGGEAGPLPKTSVALLATLASAWVLIGAYWLNEKRKEKASRPKD